MVGRLDPWQQAQIDKALRYCKKRGMTDSQINEYQVAIKPGENRVYFPYWNQRFEVTFFTARLYVENSDEPKTIELASSDKPLYGRHVAPLGKSVVLVEGVFDHFATPGSYALMGSCITKPQLFQLKADGVTRAFLIMDHDAKLTCYQQTAAIAAAGITPFPVFIEDTEKDPAQLGREAMRGLVQKLMSASFTKPRALRVFVRPRPVDEQNEVPD